MTCARTAICFLMMCHLWGAVAFAQTLPPEEGNSDFSLDSLLNIQVSTASKYAQYINEAPASISVVTASDIERYGFRTLEDVLATVRGFYVSNDRNYSYVGLRGFSRPTDYNDRLLVLLDGHSLNENFSGSAAIGTDLGLSLDDVERIEIIRGPGSALYGNYAMFAVINIITKKGNTIDGTAISAEGGSYGRAGGTMQFGRVTGGGLDYRVTVSGQNIKGPTLYFKEYDNLATDYGVSRGNDWDQSYSAAASGHFKSLTLSGIVTSRLKGVPTGAYDTKFNSPDTRTLDERRFIELKYDDRLGHSVSAMLRGYFDQYYYKGTWPYEVDQYDKELGDWAGFEGQLRKDLGPGNRLIAGVEYQQHLRASYRLWDIDTVYFDGNFPFTVASIFVEDEVQITGDLALTVGLRTDRYSTAGSATSPRGALVFSPPRLGTFKVLYGEAFRAPNAWEREIGNGVELKGNPDLKPERIRTYELVWEHRLGSALWGTASVYRYEMRDLIDQVVDPADSTAQFRNVGRAIAEGFELELNARLASGIDGYASYCFQDAKNRDDGQPLTNSPRNVFKFGSSCALGRHLRISMRNQYESGRKTVYDTETKSYFLTGIIASVKPWIPDSKGNGGLLSRFELSLTVNNLFNVRYQVPGGTELRQFAITQDGRNAVLKLTCKL